MRVPWALGHQDRRAVGETSRKVQRETSGQDKAVELEKVILLPPYILFFLTSVCPTVNAKDKDMPGSGQGL